ncbi:LOW QUALITY PROTEIN: hypothetical protein OSB04_017929 [Centaurea solstitialis]|uniref:Reverse transcriptase domain-containing protein n=1 Tax=Centaurea solstitialis TaxID=347529 RepID=A0AA38T5H4_9ASTR|nr:LOW QUALITY PROTEIN: hypothetical protein OSB04_017929 [Centaurea solstitialis]
MCLLSKSSKEGYGFVEHKQIEYFRSVQESWDVFENPNAPDFMQTTEDDMTGKGKGVIALWNIRGLNLASRRKKVKRLIIENGLCMCTIVETKVCKGKLRKFCKEIFGSWNWSQIMRFVLEFFDQVIHGRFYHVESKKKVFCSMVYAANDVVVRRLLWDQLREFGSLVKKEAWLILGDFNVSSNPADSSRGSSKITRGMLDFRECVHDIEVEDISYSGLQFTWTQKPLAMEGNKGLLKKIDRVLGNLGLLDDFPSVHASFLPFGVSDHSPAIVSFLNLSSFKPKPFKFCNHLAYCKGFLPLVSDAWALNVAGCTMFSLVSKLKVVKKGVRKLNSTDGNVFDNVKNLRDALGRIQTDCDADPENGELRDEGDIYLKALKDALCDEEKFLRQKAKIHWLKEGDANTAYFHSVVKCRVNRGRIEEVENMEGQKNFGAEVPNQFVVHFKKKLTQIQADEMVRPIDDKEIMEALFGIDDLKAPGPDGFSSRFFKKSWPIIGSEFCEAINQFFSNGKLLKEVNATVISLCISKVLVNRLKNYLDVLVDKNQSAFIPNRQICDNVLLAQELMRGYHRQRELGDVLLKGIQKLMIHVLLLLSFTIRVKGEHHRFFQRMRGIRQGDPLSPYLFTLVMEEGFKFHPRCEKIGLTHLCFANDLLMFCVGDASSVRVLKDALFEFGGVSGLKPSLEKSTCFLGNEILEILPFKLGSLPVRYLDVPLISTKLFHKDCLVLIDKVRKRVLDWKNKWLSFAGRLQLINSVLASIRSFLWSSGEAVKGKAKVAWKVVCLPREKGGLGVRDLRKWNKVLLTKLKGRCFWDVGAVFDASWFWIKVVRFREMYRHQIWHVLGDGRSTFLWTDNWHSIGPLYSLFSKRDVYMAGLDWNMKVCDLVVDGLWMWPPNIWSKAGHLLQLFQPVLKDGVSDKVLWKNSEGSLVDCVVNNVWKDMYFDQPAASWSKLIWFSQGIPRHVFFLWLAAKERLRTFDRLAEWNISVDRSCLLCIGGVESHSHLFIECPYSKALWRYLEGVLGIYNLIMGMGGTINSWADLILVLSNFKYGRSIWSVVHRLVFAAGVYFLWQETNKRKHGEAHRSVYVLARQILELIKMTLMGLKIKIMLRLGGLLASGT